MARAVIRQMGGSELESSETYVTIMHLFSLSLQITAISEQLTGTVLTENASIYSVQLQEEGTTGCVLYHTTFCLGQSEFMLTIY